MGIPVVPTADSTEGIRDYVLICVLIRPVPSRSRWLALAILCVAAFMIVLDSSVVTVALPAIQDDLGFASADLAWVVNSYLIAFGGMLLLFGRLGDLVGARTCSSPAWRSSRSRRCCAAWPTVRCC
ncbi:MFS transporter [Thermostaphylospora chromogena]|uniref:MFS transporter n=1 Tax=Thermostaphylospora chromogena TaxID=35622 RepID=UPI000A971B20|nr:MFS transporter [Thermostaphylospora chromogena]